MKSGMLGIDGRYGGFEFFDSLIGIKVCYMNIYG